MMLSVALFIEQLIELPDTAQCCIALSGGLDSRVMLHLLAKAREVLNIKLRAVHVHHGLSPNATAWANFCQATCDSYEIPLEICKVKVTKLRQQSLEEQARIERYRVFRELLEKDEFLVTAHHQDDQAETLLLQLFRGCGPKGLAGMARTKKLGNGWLLRPLLEFPRSMLKDYAIVNKLQWLEDESNRNLAFDRNFLRHSILPMLQSRWPQLSANLTRAAKHCAQADSFIEYHIVQDFEGVYNRRNMTLQVSKLLELDAEIQNYVIRYWLQYLDLSLPSVKKLQALRKDLLLSRVDAAPLIHWKGVQVRRYQDQLYAMSPLLPHDPSIIIPWNLQDDLELPSQLGILLLQDVIQMGFHHLPVPITIRFRQGGERCQLKNRKHSHSLKKLFQLWGVPPWLRERIPLLYAGDELKAIMGYEVCV